MNIQSLDLNLLRVFEAVYVERSLTRAAKTLGLSQSAVSNALIRLRDSLGQPLFVRAGQGVVPTTYAETIAADVNRALAILRGALQQAAFNYRLSDRRFTLICSDYSASVILPALLRRIEQLAPTIELHVMAMHTEQEFAQALAQGEAELAIGGMPFLSGATRQQRLFDEPIGVLARRGHPALRTRPDLQVLNHYPHVLVNPYGPWLPWEHQKTSSGSAIAPRIAIRIPTYLGVPYLLESSDYLASCPARLATLLSRSFPLEQLALPATLATVAIAQYWHERAHDDPGHQWLRQQVHDVCQSL